MSINATRVPEAKQISRHRVVGQERGERGEIWHSVSVTRPASFAASDILLLSVTAALTWHLAWVQAIPVTTTLCRNQQSQTCEVTRQAGAIHTAPCLCCLQSSCQHSSKGGTVPPPEFQHFPSRNCCCLHLPFISVCVTSPTTASLSCHLPTNSFTRSLAPSALRRTWVPGAAAAAAVANTAV
jgi:hypothetical protein